MANVALISSVMLLLVGCKKDVPPSVSATATDPGPSKPATPEVNLEERLMRQQIEVYNKLADHYEKATDLTLLDVEKPAIGALNLKLEDLMKQLENRPVEAKEAARVIVKQEWDEAQARLRKAKMNTSPLFLKAKEKMKSQQR